MKILVLQLARLGDILMCWPALRALKRARPGAEIHLVVRPRFAAAAKGLEAVSRVIALPTAELLEPLARGEADDALAVSRTAEFLAGLRDGGYDEVVNLSFSPLSSWIAKSAAGEDAVLRGYTRHDDGWLKIADGVSSYFYSQVGPGRANRIHLADLFAAQLEVDLDESDWRAPALPAKDFGLPKPYVVVHAGASESGKTVAPFVWGRAIKQQAAANPGLHFAIIGAESEKGLAAEILAHAPGAAVTDLTGRTSFEDLFGLIGGARVLLGADSAPLHVAALTATPCLNVSTPHVNFWETGPKSAGSFVLRNEDGQAVSSEAVSRALGAMLEGRIPEDAIAACPGMPSFRAPGTKGDFAWELLRGIYLEGDFPVTDDPLFVVAVQKLHEMNRTVIDQLEKIPLTSDLLGLLIDRADDVFHAIARMNAEAAVIVRWAMAEKSRIPPGTKEAIRDEMLRIHRQVGAVLALYDLNAAERKEANNGTL